MKKIYSLLILSSFTVVAYCQPAWTWINSFNAGNSQLGPARVAADGSGGVYVAGSFNGSNRPFGTYTLTAQGSSDAFIAHYDNQGNCQWAQRFGSSISSTLGTAVAVDNNGDIYLCGTYTNLLEIDTNIIFSINGSVDIFLIKMDAAGNLLWYKSCGGGGSDGANALTIDPQNNLYMAGNFYFKAYFDNDSIGNNIFNQDIYIVKFNSADSLQWIRQAGGSQDDDCSAISFSNDHFYIGGKIIGANCTFGSNTVSAVLADGFVARYDLNGTCNWVKKAGGVANDFCKGLSTDSFGNAYITGSVAQNASFGSGVSLSVGPSDEAYIAKYDSNGTCKWAKRGGSSTQADVGEGIATDSYGYSMLTGSFKGTANFTPFTLVSSGVEDAFIARYTPAGICQFAIKGGGPGTDLGFRIAALPTHEFVITGSYSGTATFGTNTLIPPSPNTHASFIGLLPGTFTGIESPEFFEQARPYPNPTSDFVYIPVQAMEHVSTVYVVNSLGQTVMSVNSIDHYNDLILDVHLLSPGIYSANATSEGSLTSFKFQVIK